MSSNPSINAVIPLESNPEVFTEFAQKLGVSPLLDFCDIYSLDDPDLLAFLPRPIEAVVLLFPVTQEYEEFKDSESVLKPDYKNVVWMKQSVKNACGLYALLHALLNIPEAYLVKQSPAARFKQSLTAGNADPIELVQAIASTMYESFGNQGQTEAPAADDDVELHFVCFVKKNNKVYELDGRREGPVVLSDSALEGDVIADDTVANRVKQYINLTTGDNAMKFALMGLAPSMD